MVYAEAIALPHINSDVALCTGRAGCPSHTIDFSCGGRYLACPRTSLLLDLDRKNLVTLADGIDDIHVLSLTESGMLSV